MFHGPEPAASPASPSMLRGPEAPSSPAAADRGVASAAPALPPPRGAAAAVAAATPPSGAFGGVGDLDALDALDDDDDDPGTPARAAATAPPPPPPPSSATAGGGIAARARLSASSSAIAPTRASIVDALAPTELSLSSRWRRRGCGGGASASSPSPSPSPSARPGVVVGRGLVNLGNSCFLNAILQALTHTTPLLELCRVGAHGRSCALRTAGRKCAFCVIERHVAEAANAAAESSEEDEVHRIHGGGCSRTQVSNVSGWGVTSNNTWTGGYGHAYGYGGGWNANGRGWNATSTSTSTHAAAAAAPVSPREVFGNLHLLARHFTRGRQEDAHELLRLCLESMDESCLLNAGRAVHGGSGSGSGSGSTHSTRPSPHAACGPRRSKPPTVVERIFQGAFRNQVKCGACGAKSNAYDPFLDVSLELPRRVHRVRDALELFTKEETLEGENAYKCEACDALRPATKRLTIHEAPAVLVIHLKRFDLFGGKISRPVAFDDVVELSGHMSDTAVESRGPRYRLYAMVVHAGSSVGCGHYYAYARASGGGGGGGGAAAEEDSFYGTRSSGDDWYLFDDAVVRPVSAREVFDDEAYVLFYERDASESLPPHAIAPLSEWEGGEEEATEPAAAAAAAAAAPEPAAPPSPPRVPTRATPAEASLGRRKRATASPAPAPAPAPANATGWRLTGYESEEGEEREEEEEEEEEGGESMPSVNPRAKSLDGGGGVKRGADGDAVADGWATTYPAKRRARIGCMGNFAPVRIAKRFQRKNKTAPAAAAAAAGAASGGGDDDDDDDDDDGARA